MTISSIWGILSPIIEYYKNAINYLSTFFYRFCHNKKCFISQFQRKLARNYELLSELAKKEFIK
jgi:hypothetical protein